MDFKYLEFALIPFALGVAIGGCSAAMKFKQIGYESGYRNAEVKLLSDGAFIYKDKVYLFCEVYKEIVEQTKINKPDIYAGLRKFQ